MNIRTFKNYFEELGYTFQSVDVLEDIFLFYKYYDNEANKGVASILLEGDPGSGKTFLSEVFSKFLGKNAEYIYTQCVEETNSDRLIATYNVPAIVKGEADKAIAAGILTRAITLANDGKKVVLTIDELDKAREALDSYFLDFLQSGKIETSNNEILSLTDDGRKNLFAIFAKNNERELSDPLLRRCSVINLPPMPPVLAYKTLLRNLDNVNHDSKFLKFVCKVYEAIYNEQMENNNLLSRLPALQELTTAITGDYELYENGISSTRRIKNLIRKLGKDFESRDIITDILVKKFKYQNKESNYDDEGLGFNLDNPNDYMNAKDSESLIEQYIEKKDSGEYIFEEDDDSLNDIATILDNMKEDQSLVFLDKENKEKIVELGTITHRDTKALELLFSKIKFKGNPNSRFGFLDFEGENFIGLMKYKNTLILVANKEYVSPRLFIRGISTIVTIINDVSENNILFDDNFYFSPMGADEFKITSLNVKILTHLPEMVLNKMQSINGKMIYNTSNLKIEYDANNDINYFRYLQKFKAEPLYEVVKKICEFNPELAIPASFINAEKLRHYDRKYVRKYSYLQDEIKSWETLKEQGWKVEIDEFQPMDFSFITKKDSDDYFDDQPKISVESDTFVFEWETEYDYKNKKLHVYPKYKLKGDYLLYTDDSDFENQEAFKQLSSFQKEIAFFARSIFGNFIATFYYDREPDYFSSLTMSQTGRIVDEPNNRDRIPGIFYDITNEIDFDKYYDSLHTPSTIIEFGKVLKKEFK